MEIEMKVIGVIFDPSTDTPVVVLKEQNGERFLPIVTGACEASAIVLEIEKTPMPRPMTHDLLKNVFVALGAPVQKVVVSDLKDNIFHSEIWVTSKDQLLKIDSRPSDAIALALRVGCPIYAEEGIFEKMRMARQNQQNKGPEKERIEQLLENIDPSKTGGHA